MSGSRLEQRGCVIRFASPSSPAAAVSSTTITNDIVPVKPPPRPHDRHSHAAQHVRRHGLCRETISCKLQEHVDSRGVQRQINFLLVDDHDAVLWIKAWVRRSRRPLSSRNTSQIHDPREIKQKLKNAFRVQRKHSARRPGDIRKQRQAP